MSIVRATLIFCITLFISLSMYVLYKFYEERYVFISQPKGVFIFDRRTEKGSQCMDGKCQPLSFQFTPARVELYPEGMNGPGIVVPKGVTVPYGHGAPAEKSVSVDKKGASYYIVPGVPYGDSGEPQPPVQFAANSEPAPPQVDTTPPPPVDTTPASPPAPAPSPPTTVTPPTATVTPPPLPDASNTTPSGPNPFEMPPAPDYNAPLSPELPPSGPNMTP